ncbi:MAG: hypothetical protein K2M17_05430 [Bacilli bacterium]|nr:hypothetical protein [Bacilli bacterium]
MKREDILEFFQLLVKKGLSDGLTFQDYHCLLAFKQYLDVDDPLYKDIAAVIANICQNGNPFLYKKEAVLYVKEHAYLLPLVVANNSRDVLMYAENSYLFSCQFHADDRNSMSVTDYKNLLHCFVCHSTYDVLSYLQAVEGLTFWEAMNLLIGIYCLDEHVLVGKLALLADKYRSVLLGSEYARLLEQGYMRFVQNGVLEVEGKNVDCLYQERFATIMRVRRKEVDSQFKGNRRAERVFLD